MTSPSVAETVRECVDKLSSADQARVLQYVRSLERPMKGVPGRDLLKFAGTISLEDLEIMKQAIEEAECRCCLVNSDA